jgi:hypothetical protein
MKFIRLDLSNKYIQASIDDLVLYHLARNRPGLPFRMIHVRLEIDHHCDRQTLAPHFDQDFSHHGHHHPGHLHHHALLHLAPHWVHLDL